MRVTFSWAAGLVLSVLRDKTGLACRQRNVVCDVMKQSHNSKSHTPGPESLVDLTTSALIRNLFFDELLFPQAACT